MDLGAVRTGAFLAAAAGDGREVFFQDGQYLAERGNGSVRGGRDGFHGCICLCFGSDADKGAGDRVGQHGVDQCAYREKTEEDSGGIDFIDQDAFVSEERFPGYPLQHSAFQEVSAALKDVDAGIACAAEQDVVIM